MTTPLSANKMSALAFNHTEPPKDFVLTCLVPNPLVSITLPTVPLRYMLSDKTTNRQVALIDRTLELCAFDMGNHLAKGSTQFTQALNSSAIIPCLTFGGWMDHAQNRNFLVNLTRSHIWEVCTAPNTQRYHGDRKRAEQIINNVNQYNALFTPDSNPNSYPNTIEDWVEYFDLQVKFAHVVARLLSQAAA